MARGAIVWDVRATPLYRKGHIPGAVSIGDAGTVLRNPVTEDFIDTAQVENPRQCRHRSGKGSRRLCRPWQSLRLLRPPRLAVFRR
jgi:rhodanese-related sulfurtransferase